MKFFPLRVKVHLYIFVFLFATLHSSIIFFLVYLLTETKNRESLHQNWKTGDKRNTMTCNTFRNLAMSIREKLAWSFPRLRNYFYVETSFEHFWFNIKIQVPVQSFTLLEYLKLNSCKSYYSFDVTVFLFFFLI